MATVNTGLFAQAGPLMPGAEDIWNNYVPQGRVKWFIAYNNNNPGLYHKLETKVLTTRLPDGQHVIQVRVKNVGTEPGFYKLFFAEAI